MRYNVPPPQTFALRILYMFPRYSGSNFDDLINTTLKRPFTSGGARGRTAAVEPMFVSCAQVFPWNTVGCDGSED